MSSTLSRSQSPLCGGRRLAVFLVCCFSLTGARVVQQAQLPYISIEDEGLHGDASLLQRSGATADAWWAQVGDRMYHAPSKESGLSRNIKDYYVTLGTTAAMSDQMKAHYVGGQGRWNILHLPDGPSMLEVKSSGDRRSAFSSLAQLDNGMVFKKTFPSFELKQDYSSGLDDATHQKEKKAVASLTPEAVQKTLTELVALPTRSYEDKDAQQHAIDFVHNKFKEMGLATSLQQFSMSGSSQTNVVACIPGKSSDSVTIGAHYDSRPYEGAAPGAEDNGSGVAVMLNIAKSFLEAKASPTKTVYFVGFAAEEPGLLGSKAFVEELKAGGQKFPAECRSSGQTTDSFLQSRRLHGDDEKVRHKGIVLDEVGWKSPSLPKPTLNLESFDWTNHDVMQHMGQASKEYNPDVEVIHNNAPFGSDHMSFLDNHMPAVLAINGDDEAYPHYHQSSDTLDNVDFALASSIGKMSVAALMRMSCA